MLYYSNSNEYLASGTCSEAGGLNFPFPSRKCKIIKLKWCMNCILAMVKIVKCTRPASQPPPPLIRLKKGGRICPLLDRVHSASPISTFFVVWGGP